MFVFHSFENQLTQLFFSAAFHDQFLRWAGIPLTESNRDRTGGRGVEPGSDSEDCHSSNRSRARAAAAASNIDSDDSFVEDQEESFESAAGGAGRSPRVDPPASRMNQADNIFADIDRAAREFSNLHVDDDNTQMKTFAIKMEGVRPRGDSKNPRTLFAAITIPDGGVDNGTVDFTLQPNARDVNCHYVSGKAYTNSANYIAPEMSGNTELTDKFTAALDLLFRDIATHDKTLPSEGLIRLAGRAENNGFGGLVDP